MEKPPGVGQTTAFLNNVPLIDLPQKEIVAFARKILNGSSKDLLFRVETDLRKCQSLWEQFSPKESLFDLWSFRLAFYRGYQYQPYFITLSFQGKVVSVLPLWFDQEDDQYTWFGGSWPEDNTLFTNLKTTVPLLLKLVPGTTKLFCILPQGGVTDLGGTFLDDEAKYVLNVKNFQSLEDYYGLLKKKKRYNLKRDWKRIQALKPEIIVNNFAHLKDLFQLNIGRFDGMVLDDSKSTFLPKEKQKTFKEILNLAQDYEIRMLSTLINKKIVSVDLVAIYNRTYYCLGGGCDVENYSGLGTFANLLLIKDAIELPQVDNIDFLQGDLNWKKSWQLTPRPLFKFVKDFSL
ncbi:GNAT family N-acetyltransferase [Candidatus Shapirobacteria bacterium]|nr:GNAT family N-acetyltransferase [Candidatus Shapirobacteria bacterium]